MANNQTTRFYQSYPYQQVQPQVARSVLNAQPSYVVNPQAATAAAGAKPATAGTTTGYSNISYVQHPGLIGGVQVQHPGFIGGVQQPFITSNLVANGNINGNVIVNGNTVANASVKKAEQGKDYKTLTPATQKPNLVKLNKKSSFKNLIDGKLEESAQSYEVINPATGKAFDICPSPTLADLDRAVAAGTKAFKTWSQTTVEERKNVLLAISKAIGENVQVIAEILAKEQGKPLAKATEEVATTSAWFQITAGFDLKVDTLPSLDGSKVTVHRRPLGLTAGIIPWNYPVLLLAWKVAPALLCGNTIIVKPSPFTPLATLKLGEVIKDVVPAGVVQILSGDDSFGAAITKNPAIAKVSFTGSAATGRKVMQTAAETLKRTVLELGGNDAAIVLKDAKVKDIAPAIFEAAFENSGQVCVALKRLYVHESLYDEMVNELATLAKDAKVGAYDEKDVKYGPLNNKMQYDRVLELLNDAKAHGAKVYAGGDRINRDGYFIQPTILGNVKDGDRIVDEEQFGPVLPVLSFKDEEEAIERANNTLFGLGGSVWGTDVEHATQVASRLQSGSVWLNQHLNISPFAPFGGSKCSGIGTDNGEKSLDGWSQLQVVSIKN